MPPASTRPDTRPDYPPRLRPRRRTRPHTAPAHGHGLDRRYLVSGSGRLSASPAQEQERRRHRHPRDRRARRRRVRHRGAARVLHVRRQDGFAQVRELRDRTIGARRDRRRRDRHRRRYHSSPCPPSGTPVMSGTNARSGAPVCGLLLTRPGDIDQVGGPPGVHTLVSSRPRKAGVVPTACPARSKRSSLAASCCRRCASAVDRARRHGGARSDRRGAGRRAAI